MGKYTLDNEFSKNYFFGKHLYNAGMAGPKVSGSNSGAVLFSLLTQQSIKGGTPDHLMTGSTGFPSAEDSVLSG